jgi:hypothetical protein
MVLPLGFFLVAGIGFEPATCAGMAANTRARIAEGVGVSTDQSLFFPRLRCDCSAFLS